MVEFLPQIHQQGAADMAQQYCACLEQGSRFQRVESEVSEMAQAVKALAAKPDDLTPNSEIPMGERERELTLPNCPLTSPPWWAHKYPHNWAYLPTYTQ